MPDIQPLCKVTAYITRMRAGEKEMLVFRHPSAGIQLPAGTVEDGETPENAVLREVMEETGLVEPEIARWLGVEETQVPPHQRAVLSRSPLLAQPRTDAPQIGVVGRSGFLLDVGNLEGVYRQVTHRKHQFEGDVFVPTQSTMGWTREDNLTDRILRHHFEIRSLQPTEERWVHFAEGEYDFECYWAPIREDIGLAASNLAWLRFVIDKLLQ